MKLEIISARTTESESLSRSVMRATVEIYPDCDEVQFEKWKGRRWMRFLVVTERPPDARKRRDEIDFRWAKVRMFRCLARRELEKVKRLKSKPYLQRQPYIKRARRTREQIR